MYATSGRENFGRMTATTKWTDSLLLSLRRGVSRVGPLAAIEISLKRAACDRDRQLIGLGYSLIFGAFFGVATHKWLLSFSIAMSFALVITFFSSIPWRIKVCRGNGMLLNALLAAAFGSVLTYLVYFVPFAFLEGARAVPWLNGHLLLPVAGGMIVMASGLFIVLDEERQRQARRQKRQTLYFERLANEARVIAMRNQINPHFFFNTLNTIVALIPARPADAERAVELLAQALRPALDGNGSMLKSFAEELEIARAYTEIESLRFGERIRFDFDIDPAANSVMLPVLTLQPLLENAVRYGAARTDRRYRISIRATVDAQGLWLYITNAPEAEAGTEPRVGDLKVVTMPGGHAIRNISHRCKAFYGRKVVVDVRSDDQLTGLARIFIPAGEPSLHSVAKEAMS